MAEALPPEDQRPLQRALVELHEMDFEAEMAALPSGWTLEWRRRGARWITHAADLDDLGLLLLGWLGARQSADVDETDYAERLS